MHGCHQCGSHSVNDSFVCLIAVQFILMPRLVGAAFGIPPVASYCWTNFVDGCRASNFWWFEYAGATCWHDLDDGAILGTLRYLFKLVPL